MDTDLRPILAEASDFFPNLMTSGSFSDDQGLRLKQPESPSTQAPYLPSITQLNPGIYGNGNGNQRGSSVAQALSQGSPTTQTSSIPCMSASDDTRRVFPLEDVQEACLLRYYIEEISHWVSTMSHIIEYLLSHLLTVCSLTCVMRVDIFI